jgi:hypothetical protein
MRADLTTATRLTDAHVALIKILAAQAVEDFLAEEVEASATCTDETGQQYEEITQ